MKVAAGSASPFYARAEPTEVGSVQSKRPAAQFRDVAGNGKAESVALLCLIQPLSGPEHIDNLGVAQSGAIVLDA